ncbi:MAG: iron-containing alcohol dehydrogenase [Deltaproteobacteria bacterium]|nr:iron-containing alcohol dehydrogenase [Deltaproteobacteria bacterium]MBW1950360.1 iron-containing alcohol dehydrogenase [Deltaproteobacteria bacterium]MBW2008098.1 iron-containing alcohol dehydrogenase [Deltaproteobacteria bacterium]
MPKAILNISLPSDMQIGPGCFKRLGRKTKDHGMKHPLLVCDQTMVRLGLAQQARDNLEGAGVQCTVFDGCPENPRDETVAAATSLYEEKGCDGLVALGGGSVIDSAKAVRVVGAQGGAAVDYDVKQGGIKKIGRELPPMIAVPTTSGTGSEATLASVIIDTARQVKFTIFSPYLMPSGSLLDPELTVSMPPGVTAATGFDALIHALEAYTSNMAPNPVADGLCRTNFELVGKSFLRAVKDGEDLEARTDMAVASMLGGVVLTMKGLGAVHALSHQLSSFHGIPHGTANALMLPHVMRFNAPEAGERYREALGFMGLAATSAEDAADRMAELVAESGLPTRLQDLGVKEDDLERLAEEALADISLPVNPVPCTREDLIALYRKAL